MRVWAGVGLFFGVGVAMGLSVSATLAEQAGFFGDMVGAVGIGASAGVFGAWLVFAIAIRVAHRIRSRRFRNAEADAATYPGRI